MIRTRRYIASVAAATCTAALSVAALTGCASGRPTDDVPNAEKHKTQFEARYLPEDERVASVDECIGEYGFVSTPGDIDVEGVRGGDPVCWPVDREPYIVDTGLLLPVIGADDDVTGTPLGSYMEDERGPWYKVLGSPNEAVYRVIDPTALLAGTGLSAAKGSYVCVSHEGDWTTNVSVSLLDESTHDFADPEKEVKYFAPEGWFDKALEPVEE